MPSPSQEQREIDGGNWLFGDRIRAAVRSIPDRATAYLELATENRDLRAALAAQVEVNRQLAQRLAAASECLGLAAERRAKQDTP